MLVKFDPNFRRTWMFPRNIRMIEPWKLDQILTLLMATSADFASQTVQDALYEELGTLGVKGSGSVRDHNSGGFRTYLAQLSCLGLVYKDPSDGWKTTIAGNLMLDHQNPLDVLRVQLIRHQYPSTYSEGHNIKVHPDIKVKPFILLLDLMNDEKLDGLTTQEMAIPVVYGHNANCYDLCVQKILAVRENKNSLNGIIEDPLDLYTPRAKDRSLEKGLEDVLNIANTAKNYLLSAQLIQSSEDRRWRAVCDENVAFLTPLINEERHYYIPIQEDKNSFQRAYGRGNREKDNRGLNRATDGFSRFIQSRFIGAINASPFSLDTEAFIKECAKNYGKLENEIWLAIGPVLPKRRCIERDVYLQYARSGGTLSREFELATTAIFKKLGFSDSIHIGQRKSKLAREGGFPDIYIKAKDMEFCGMADTKATAKFKVSFNDRNKLRDFYRESYREIDPDTPLAFYLYIAGGFNEKEMTKTLDDCSNMIGVPVTALTAEFLLGLYEKSQTISPEKLCDWFSRSHCYVNAGQFPA